MSLFLYSAHKSMVFFSLLPASAGFLLDLLFGPDD
jgi:hypothetical protein